MPNLNLATVVSLCRPGLVEELRDTQGSDAAEVPESTPKTTMHPPPRMQPTRYRARVYISLYVAKLEDRNMRVNEEVQGIRVVVPLGVRPSQDD